jgi:hypothetical protein
VTDVHAQPAGEEQLEALLRGLLDKEVGPGAGAPPDREFRPEIVELRDTARLLRAASQWVPLPAGRTAVRRALLTAVRQEPARDAWRRTRRWLGAVGAAAAIVAAFDLGVGPLAGLGSPAGPLYALRLGIDAAGVTLAPGPSAKAELLVRAAHARILEIDRMVSEGDLRGMRRAAAALDDEAAWLHAIAAALSPADRRRLERALGR